MEQEFSITELGNPAKPQGEAGAQMLAQMNEHHYAVSGWGIGHLHLQNDDRILDIGCGGGETLARLSALAPHGKLCGVDYSPVSVASSTQRNAPDISCGKMRIIEASVEHLPFDDNAFDRIVTVESFYFWPNPAENLKEVFRVLAKGGQFLIIADIHGDAELSQDDIDNIQKYSLRNPSPDEFQHLLQNAGFSDVQIHLQNDTTWICAEGSKT